MNILEQEDLVKGLPDQVLIQYAQEPTAEIPQFLVVSELDRRQRMRKNFAERVPEETVTDQVISQGIAAMNPNPDPLMNAAMGVQDPMMQDPMMQQQMMGQDPMMQQPPMDQQMMPPQDPMMMAAGGGMMPYRMSNGGGAPRMSQVPQLTQEQLNAILAGGITAEEAELLASYGMSFDDLALGQRLNNPLNVRSSAANQWEGGDPTIREEGYEGFTGPDFGIRAADRVLDTYGRDRGIGTLAEALNRFAPESENPTQSYIDFVSGRSGIDPGAPLDLTNPAVRALLLSPMAEFESKSIYSPGDITESIARANELIEFSSPALQKDAAKLSEKDVTPELVEASLADSPPAEEEEEKNLAAKENIETILAEARSIAPEERERFIQESRNPFKSVVEESFSEVGPSLVQALEDRQELLNKQLQSDPMLDPLAGGDLEGIGTPYARLDPTLDPLAGGDLKGIGSPYVKRVPVEEKQPLLSDALREQYLNLPAVGPADMSKFGLGVVENKYPIVQKALGPEFGRATSETFPSLEGGLESIYRSGRDASEVIGRDMANLSDLLGVEGPELTPAGEYVASLIGNLKGPVRQPTAGQAGESAEELLASLPSRFGELVDSILPSGQVITKKAPAKISSLDDFLAFLGGTASDAFPGLAREDNAQLDAMVAGMEAREKNLKPGAEEPGFVDSALDAVSGLFASEAQADEGGDQTDVKGPIVTTDGTQGGPVTETEAQKLIRKQGEETYRRRMLAAQGGDGVVPPGLKPSFAGTDPAIGGLALAQLGAGIAQGEIGKGISAGTKVLTDERDSAARRDYYRAMADKAARRDPILSFDDALAQARAILNPTGYEQVSTEAIYNLALQLTTGTFTPPPAAGGAEGLSEEEKEARAVALYAEQD